MDLLERYLNAIKPLLPRKTKDDILREISDDILSQMEDKAEALNRPLNEAEQAEIIRKHGHPIVATARYGATRYLIGPEIFPVYWLILKISIIAALVVRLVVELVGVLLSPNSAHSWVPALLKVPTVLIPVFFWVTAVFAAYEFCQSFFNLRVRVPWDPRSLTEREEHAVAIPRSHSLAELLFGIAGLICWQMLLSAPYLFFGSGASLFTIGPGWKALYWPVLLLIVAGLAQAAVNLARPYQTATRRWLRLATRTAGIAVLGFALRLGNWVAPAPWARNAEQANSLAHVMNQVFFYCLIAGFIIGALQLAWEWFRHFRGSFAQSSFASRSHKSEKRKVLGVFLFVFFAIVLSAQDGSAIYKSRCAACHDKPVGRIPPVSALRAMTSGAIRDALDHGSMQTQAEGLSAAERKAVAEYLSQSTPEQGSTVPNACPSGNATPELAASEFAWASWGATPENTRFQDAKQAGLSAAELPKLELKWAFRLDDEKSPRSQPAVAFGRVFVGAGRDLYALDAKSGCAYWVFHADEPVRSAIAVSMNRHAVFFGAHSTLYAVSAATGKLLWKKRIDTHPAALLTAAPAVYAGVLYVPVSSFEEALAASPKYACCTFRGSVVALNAANGDRLWKTYTIQQHDADAQGPSGAAVWSTPTFDNTRNRLYIATGDNYSNPPSKTSDAVLALDAKTGKIVWSRQLTPGDVYNIGCDIRLKKNCPAGSGNDFDFGQPPILVPLANGKRALVIGQKSGIVHALDPDAEGKPLWSRRIGKGGKLGGIQWGSAAANSRVFVAVSDIALAAVPDKSSPQGFRLVLNPRQGGGLFALDAATGKIVWSAKPPSCDDRKLCSPAQSAPVTAIPGAVFSGSVDGHLRAYATENGTVLWDANTEREYDVVNGGKAHGGSLDVTGPVIAGGMIYVTSGYAQWGGMPGNALLAYGAK